MGRPHKFRKLSKIRPKYQNYIPDGLSDRNDILTMYLSAEEFEALRLRYYEELKQTEAAIKMAISQTTYSRIINRAHEKLTKAFIEGFAISFQIHPSQRKCPHVPQHRKRKRGIQKMDPQKGLPSRNPEVIFNGFGCQECGFEWVSPNSIHEKSTGEKISPVPEKIDVDKKEKCPECGSKQIYVLIKKLSPEI